MRLWAPRLLHVLLSVPVVTSLVVAASPTAHAQGAPTPVVIVIDPGHGGASDANHPDMPFDPGAIAPSNGVQEKDVTLAVSLRLRSLLENDDVKVVLTRSDDRALSIQQRSDTANHDSALVFVSVHMNSFTDSTASGSLVLYPSEVDLGFARAMSDALGRQLQPLGIPDDGVQLRDNWWIHTQMPTVTVEPLYLSNAREASMVPLAGFQQLLAMGIRDGIERFQPLVLQRKAQITAWNATHPEQPVSPASSPVAAHAHASAQGGWEGTAVRALLLIALLAAVIRWPRAAWGFLVSTAGLLQGVVEHLLVRRAANRRRRRAVLRRAEILRVQRFTRPHHVFDELF